MRMAQIFARSLSVASRARPFRYFHRTEHNSFIRTNKTSYLLDLSRDFKEQTPQPLPRQEKEGDYFVAWDWSPDGKKLGGTFNGNSGTAIGYFSFKTQRYERLANYDALPMWFPDSNRFIFSNEGKAMIAEHRNKEG